MDEAIPDGAGGSTDPAARLRELEAENRRLRAALAQAEAALVRGGEPGIGGRTFRAVLDQLPAMISYWDVGMRNLFANRAYAHWFGVPAERMKGLHVRDLLGPEMFRLNAPLIEAALRGEPQVFERGARGIKRFDRQIQLYQTGRGRGKWLFLPPVGRQAGGIPCAAPA